MNKKYIYLVFLFFVLFLAGNVFAQFNPTDTFTAPKETNGFDLGKIMGNVADQVWYIFAGLAIIMFLIAGIKFLTAQGNVKTISEARQAVIWGVVGIGVGILAGGIISFVARIIG